MRNSGCASSKDFLPWRPRRTRLREGKRRKRATGGRPALRGGSPRPPHREPRRRQRGKCLGRAWKCSPPGGLQKRWCAPWRRRRVPRWRSGVPRRHPGVSRRRQREPQRHPPNPRGRESAASHPEVGSRSPGRFGFERPKPNSSVLCILSVRKVVPTLTNNERRGLSLNGRC
jgi:hypothetical protein